MDGSLSPSDLNLDWHSVSADEALSRLKSSREGLATDEAQRRQERFGPNRLEAAARRGPIMRFLYQFHNVLIYILLAAAGVTAILSIGDRSHLVDTGVILGVVVINALIGFIQEGKAEAALEAIAKMLSLEATVIREGKRHSLPAEQIVPGDVLLLRSGDKVPADVRLLESRELRIDEAMLTGESVPVEKGSDPVATDTALGDRESMAFSGTLVTSGQGLGVVVATGNQTEIGKISELVTQTEATTTPLIRQVTSFGRMLALVIVGLAAGTIVFGWMIRDLPVVEMFLAGVALAVAAIPEGLPATMTIVLAIGVQRMAARNAIIRRLYAVDTLGALTCICSDKTGTLTRNEMTVTQVLLADRRFEVTGVGYAPEGGLVLDDSPVDPAQDEMLLQTLRAGLLCNDADLRERDGQWQSEGDPMEGALITLAMKAGLDVEEERGVFRTVDTVPFASKNRFMATLHRPSKEGDAMIYVKGAPERILTMCDRQAGAAGEQPLDADAWRQKAEDLANQGQRVLAVAYRPADEGQDRVEYGDVQQGLMWLGMFGIIDPPRSEAIEAVRQCRDAGIAVKMITGDHALTARAIGAAVGIGDGTSVRTGVELDRIADEQLPQTARDVDVFARVSPEHKLRLMRALQDTGHVAAMTGDGVNDAPALKRADVGIAMGIKGTEASKEAAEMVLADDNFASIAHAVEEGRTVYDNLRKAILFLLPTNGGEALTILGAVLLGRTLPLTPVQVLWVNMITAVTLGLALAFEPPESNVMRRPPRDPKSSLLSWYFLWRISFVTLLLFAVTFGMFIWMRSAGFGEAFSRTVAVNALVMGEIFYLLNARFIIRPTKPTDLRGNPYVLLAIGIVVIFQVLFTYLPLMQTLFGTQGIGALQWLAAIMAGFAVFVLVEIEKAVVRVWKPEVVV